MRRAEIKELFEEVTVMVCVYVCGCMCAYVCVRVRNPLAYLSENKHQRRCRHTAAHPFDQTHCCSAIKPF